MGGRREGGRRDIDGSKASSSQVSRRCRSGNIENGDDEMEHIDFIIHHVKRFSSNPD